MDDVVILSAARTPIGAFQGALASLPAHALGARALTAELARFRANRGEKLVILTNGGGAGVMIDDPVTDNAVTGCAPAPPLRCCRRRRRGRCRSASRRTSRSRTRWRSAPAPRP